MGWSPPSGGGGGGGSIDRITSSSATVTNPTGPTTDIEVTPSGIGARPLASPATHYVPGASPPNTKQTVMRFGGAGFYGLNSTIADCNQRFAWTPTVAYTQCRIRIKNQTIVPTPATSSALITIAGISMGKPATSGLTTWAGAFSSLTPVIGAQSPQSLATEWVSPWFTPPTVTPYQPIGISIGLNCPATSDMYYDNAMQGICYSASSGTAQSAQFNSTSAPTGGTVTQGIQLLDIAIEYQFVGDNPIGVYIGTSLTNGSLWSFNLNYGLCGPDEQWPHMAALKLGHCDSNGGLSGASTPTFDGATTGPAWTRILDGTTPTQWPGNCLPDYAVIDLGVNDALPLSAIPLATFQTNIAAIIANLNALGVNKIIVCTVPPGGTQNFQSGLANAAYNGTITSMVVKNAGASLGPGGGYCGLAASWNSQVAYIGCCTQSTNGIGIGGQDVTAGNVTASQAANMTLSFASTTLTQSHYKNDIIMNQAEGYRQLYNKWIRSGVLGSPYNFDLNGAVVNNSQGIVGFEQVSYRFFNTGNTGPHPNDPSMYETIASAFATTLVGL